MKKLSRKEYQEIYQSGSFEKAMAALEQFTVKKRSGGRQATVTPEKKRADTRERVRRFRAKQQALKKKNKTAQRKTGK